MPQDNSSYSTALSNKFLLLALVSTLLLGTAASEQYPITDYSGYTVNYQDKPGSGTDNRIIGDLDDKQGDNEYLHPYSVNISGDLWTFATSVESNNEGNDIVAWNYSNNNFDGTPQQCSNELISNQTGTDYSVNAEQPYAHYNSSSSTLNVVFSAYNGSHSQLYHANASGSNPCSTEWNISDSPIINIPEGDRIMLPEYELNTPNGPRLFASVTGDQDGAGSTDVWEIWMANYTGSGNKFTEYTWDGVYLAENQDQTFRNDAVFGSRTAEWFEKDQTFMFGFHGKDTQETGLTSEICITKGNSLFDLEINERNHCQNKEKITETLFNESRDWEGSSSDISEGEVENPQYMEWNGKHNFLYDTWDTGSIGYVSLDKKSGQGTGFVTNYSIDGTSFKYGKQLNITSTLGHPTIGSKSYPLHIVNGSNTVVGEGNITVPFSQFGTEDCSDLRFLNETDNGKLDFGIEECDFSTSDGDGKEIWAWVNIAEARRNGDDEIHMYWGNESSVSPGFDNEAVWSSSSQNTLGVYYLNESSGQTYDSSGNDYDSLSTTGTVFDVSGPLDGSRGFDGSDDIIELPSGLSGQGDYTVVGSLEPDLSRSSVDTNRAFFGIRDSSTTGFSIHYGTDTSNGESGIFDGDNYDGFGLQFNKDSFYHTAVSIENGTGYDWYQDAGQKASNVGSIDTSGSVNSYIGGRGGGEYWDGRISDLRVYSGLKNSDWIRADFDASSLGGQRFFSQTQVEQSSDSSTDSTAPNISFNPSTNSDGSTVSRDWVFVNVSASDETSLSSVTEEFDGSNSSFNTNQGSNYWTNHTGLSDGSYSFQGFATDGNSNINSTSTRTVTVDTAAPSITVQHPTNTTYSSSSLDLNVTTDENANFTYNVDGGTNTSVNEDDQDLNESLSVSDGTHTVNVYASDANSNTKLASRTFTVDTTAPTTSDDYSSSGWQSSTVTVSLTPSDATTNVSSTSYRVNGGSWSSGTSVTISTEGNNTLEYNSTDYAGNQETIQKDYVAIDTVAPTFSSFSEQHPSTYKKYDTNSSTSWSDSTSGFSTSTLEHNFTGTPTNISSSSSIGRELSAGTYYTKFYGQDVAGNYNSTTKKVFTIAKASSKLNIVFNTSKQTKVNDNITIDKNTNLTVTADLNITFTGQIKDSIFDLFENNTEIGTLSRNNISYTKNYSSTGSWFYNSTFDGNENISAATRDPTVKVTDSSGPTFTIHDPVDGNTFNFSQQNSFTLDLNVSSPDTVDTWLRNLDTGSNQTFTPNTTISYGSEGSHNVTVWANNSNGYNSGTSSFTIAENNNPSASLTTSTSDLTVDVDGSGSSDNDGSINKYEWDWTSDGTYEDTGKTASHDYSSDGDYDITLRVTDDDGATDTKTKTVSVSSSSSGGSGGGGGGSGSTSDTAPNLTVYDPALNDYEIENVPIKFLVEDDGDLDSCWYSVDGGANQSISCSDGSNATGSFSVPKIGSHTFTAYANSTEGNESYNSTSWTGYHVNEIRAEDSSGNTLSDFSVTFENETDTLGKTSQNSKVLFNTSDIPYNSTNISVKKKGFQTKKKSYSVNDSFDLNKSFTLNKATMSYVAKNVKNLKNISYQAKFSNNSESLEVRTDKSEGALSETLDVQSPSGYVEVKKFNFSYEMDADKFRFDIKDDTTNGNDDDLRYKVNYTLLNGTEIRSNEDFVINDGQSTYQNHTINLNTNQVIDYAKLVVKRDTQTESISSNVLRSYEISSDTKGFEVNYNSWKTKGPTGTIDIRAESNGFAPRTVTHTWNGRENKDIVSYLLKKVDGTTVPGVKVLTASGKEIENAQVELKKEINGKYQKVQSKTTTSSGQASFFVDLSEIYNVDVSHPNYKDKTESYDPASHEFSPKQIIMDSLVDAEFEGVTYKNGIQFSCSTNISYVSCQYGVELDVNFENMTLDVNEENDVGFNDFKQTSSTKQNDTLTITGFTADNKSYQYVLSADVDGNEKRLESGIITRSSDFWKQNQLAVGFILFLALSALGFGSPKTTVALSTVGMVVAAWTNAFVISTLALGSLIFGALMVVATSER